MEIQIVRLNHKPWGIDGHLYINRRRICDTVEHPTRHLPAGEYILSSLGAEGSSLSEASSLGAAGSSLSEASPFSPFSPLSEAPIPIPIPFPFRHGDGALASTKGEIIVGKQLMSGLVTQSQQTYDRLYERLKKAWQRGGTVRLLIVG